MKDKDKTKEQPIDEMAQVRPGIVELEQSGHKRKEAEIAAQSAVSYAENVVDTVREPLLVLDAGLKIISANHSFYNVFTVTPDETIGRLIYDLGNRQWDIPGLRRLLEDILQKNVAFKNYEVEHTFPALGHKIMLLNARRILQDETSTMLILLSIEDITERKQNEMERRESEERYQKVFETSRDGYLLLDRDTGKIVNVNKAIAVLLGYYSEELTGKELKAAGILKDKDIQSVIQELKDVGFLYYADVPVETKERRRIDAAIYLVDGAKFIQCSVCDITEQKIADERLKISEQRFRNLVANTSDFVWEIDEKATFTYVTWAKNLLGYEPEEMLGKIAFDLMQPEEARRVAEIFGTLAAQHKPIRFLEHTLLHKDGHSIAVESSGVPFFNTQGRLAGYHGLSHDITRRKLAENALRESENEFRNFSEIAPNAIIVMNNDGNISFWNKEAENIFG